MILGEWLLPTALILLLADERAFSRFVKFSLWYVPLMLFIIFGIFPVGLPLGGAIESAAAARALAVLYALAALGIVLAGKLRKPAA
ncbi:MAG TPA: hypothetical protein VHC68_00225 [Candidatus Paceibacterota bacterium]|nr:hypothetical protein [Candidatus Paceibacterota bacterium]